MIRPPVAVVLMLFAALGLAVGGRADGFYPLFTTVPLLVGGWFINATVLNDLADEPIDRVNLANARGRPLVSGQATRMQLLVLGLAAGAAAVICAWLINWRVGTVITIGLALNLAYSMPPLRLSHRGLLAVVLLPLGYVALPFLVGAFLARPTLGPTGLGILIGLYISFMGRIVLKDFRDEAGDTLFGKRTFLVRRGRIHTCIFSAVCWVTGCGALITIVPLRSAIGGVFAVYVGCVLYGLSLLARSDDYAKSQVIIGAIAVVGRGMAITLLAHLTMLAKAWAETDQMVLHLAVACAFVWVYLETLGQRETLAADAVRPF